jgi:NDP-sugar pyrophosphorylase family protein
VTSIDAPRAMAILAGGTSARMEALRGTIYKAFLPIHGISLVARHVLRAVAFGICSVDVIVDAYDPALAQLARSADAQPPATAHLPDVRVLVHPGTQVDKILWWHDRLEGSPKALVVLGDTLAPVDIGALWQHAMSEEFDSAIGLVELQLPFGAVLVDGRRVRSFREKPASGFLVNTGYMVLGPAAIRYMREGMELGGVLEDLARDELLGALVCGGPLTTVDSLESLAAAHQVLAGAACLEAT